MNKEINKIKSNEIFRNPIDAIYKSSAKELEKIFNTLSTNLLNLVSYNPEDVDKTNNNIKENLQDIKKDYESKNIFKKKLKNFGIGAGFIVGIGFIWWKQFKENKEIIKEHNKYALMKKGDNINLTNYKIDLISSYFNSMGYSELYDTIMENLGIVVDYDFKVSEINEYLEKQNIYAIYSIWKGWLRNTPIYDLSAWHLYWKKHNYKSKCN